MVLASLSIALAAAVLCILCQGKGSCCFCRLLWVIASGALWAVVLSPSSVALLSVVALLLQDGSLQHHLAVFGSAFLGRERERLHLNVQCFLQSLDKLQQDLLHLEGLRGVLEG